MAQITAIEAARVLRRFRSKLEGDVEEIQGLNITAMMDMMTILLVFLLKSFSVSAWMITPSDQDLTLPKSVVAARPADYLVVTVTKQAVLVEGQYIVGISAGRGHDFEKEVASSFEVKELKKALESIGKINEYEAKQAGKPFERRMLLVADKDTPYYVVVAVVYTAVQAKYIKYQMVVISTTGG